MLKKRDFEIVETFLVFKPEWTEGVREGDSSPSLTAPGVKSEKSTI